MPFEGSRAPRLDEPLDWTNHPFDPKGYVLGIVAQRGAQRMQRAEGLNGAERAFISAGTPRLQIAEGLNGAERAFICAGTPRLDETTPR